MEQAFIIMQVGNPELDIVCEKAIVPALKACNLDPKRVDKHNEGCLLQSEIAKFIKSARIIVADLTNERPNCYLEIGYSMGLDRFGNLILTAREDHNQDSPNHKKGGPKVHFDLSGYDVLFWNPRNLEGFKVELEKRVKHRLSLPRISSPEITSHWVWIAEHRKNALEGLKKSGWTGFMEIRMTLLNLKLSDISHEELLRAAKQAQVYPSDWCLGIVLEDEHGPKAIANGIVAEIPYDGTYDYWTIREDGCFYLLKNLFEDTKKPGSIFYDWRIKRTTEALLYCSRLYSSLNVPQNSSVVIGIGYGGLKERILSAAGEKHIRGRKTTKTDEVFDDVTTILEKIEPDLVNLVEKLTRRLFALFNFFKVSKREIEEIINKCVEKARKS